jgi:glycosyltransferase involved in cell wall biosynthesis
MRDQTNVTVLQLGPGLAVHGGVAAVERVIVERLAGRIALRHVATMEDGPLLRKLAVFARAIYALQRALRTPGPLVVHIHFASRGSALRKVILAWMTVHAQRPLILHAHGGAFDAFFRRLPAMARRMLSDVFQRADRFVVLSDRWKTFYEEECELSPSQVLVLPNPARVPLEIPDRRARARVQFLFLGRICESKGAFDAIRAFARLPVHERERARLVLAGDGDVAGARKLAASLDATVTVLPWVDSRRRDALLAASDVFVLPSYREGLPMAMLEAMASGMPVIVTPVGGIPDVVRDGVEGSVVVPGDIVQLSLAMRPLISDSAYRWELGRHALERARQFDADAYARSLLGLYRRLSPITT